jgi:ribosomal protein L17
VATFRSAIIDAVTEDDVREVVEAVVAEAKGGNLTAARILLDRLLGPPVAADLVARLEALEELIAGE